MIKGSLNSPSLSPVFAAFKGGIPFSTIASVRIFSPALLQYPFGTLAHFTSPIKIQSFKYTEPLLNVSIRSFSNQKKKKKTGSKKRKERITRKKDATLKVTDPVCNLSL
jgi:hypothetical protein